MLSSGTGGSNGGAGGRVGTGGRGEAAGMEAAGRGGLAGADAGGEGIAGASGLGGSAGVENGGSGAGTEGSAGTAGVAAAGAGGTAAVGCGADDTACAPASGVLGFCKANVCVSCAGGASGNTSCSAAYGNGAGYVCASGNCAAGQCVSNGECPSGQLCGVGSANQCGGCVGDAQCTGGGGYGAGYLCIGGACLVADCRADNDCGSGRICGLNTANRCAPCAADDQCHNDATTYGPTFICDTSAGRCVPGSCALNNRACSANQADFCCGGACVAGNCCGSADCAALGNNYSCTNHVCTRCALATGNTYYVDPAAGSDTIGTGNNSTFGCAFKTISRALAVIGSAPNPATRVLVLATGPVGVASNAEQFPIDVPSNVVIGGNAGRVQVLVPANTNGFLLHHPGSGLTNLTIDGQGNRAAYGIYVSSGADDTTVISALDVQNMGGDGIRVVGSGVLSIRAGVHVTLNGTSGSPADGLYVTDQGRAKIDVTAGDPVHFDRNTARGIYVNKSAAIELNGSPGSGGNGTITTNSNLTAGLWIEQTPAANLPLNTVTGLVSWANPGYGMRIAAGSAARVRQSYVLANGASGILVSTYINGMTRNNDTSKINLGTSAGPSYGGNTVQAALGSNPNVGAGICLTLDRGAGAALNAAGNLFAGPIDCSTSTATLRRSTRCSGSVDYAVRNNGPTSNTIVVARCR
jgi:hypothetical protein